MTGFTARIHRNGVASDCFITRSGKGKQASDCGDRALDESFIRAKEWACSPDLYQGWGR